MDATTHRTPFARLSRTRARLVLALWLSATTFFVAVSLSPLASSNAHARRPGGGNVELYWAEVQRIHAGENYYAAAGAELRSRGYPTRSVFNWRTPLPVWLLGTLPNPALGQALLAAAGFLVLVFGYELVYRDAGCRTAVLSAILLTGALLWCVLGKLYVMPVLWSGVFIALSLTAYGLNRHSYAIAAGLAALFLRELAAPYCLICLAIAVRQRHKREIAVWVAGLVAYGAFFAWHALQVAAVTGPHEVAHQQGWLRLGGAAFLISLAQMNAYLLLLPQWIGAVYLGLVMIGFASWSSPAGARCSWTACAYLAAFAIIGQPFNQYWGCLIAPLFCLGAARAPAALIDLWKRAISEVPAIGFAPSPAR